MEVLEPLGPPRFYSEALDELVRALSETGPLSVDALLEYRPEFLTVGKLAIAAALLPREGGKSVFNSPRDWLGYLISRMRASPEDFAQNRVSFVTFNYDRLIEHRLTRAVAAQYRLNPVDAWEVVKGIKVVHVYGQLGEYAPVLAPDTVAVSDEADMSISRVQDRVLRAADEITLIHEREKRQRALAEAQRLIANAERVFFLGFGYDTTNLQRLGTRLNTTRNPNMMIGSAFGLKGGQIREAQRLIAENFSCVVGSTDGQVNYGAIKSNSLDLVDPSYDALDVLLEHADLLR